MIILEYKKSISNIAWKYSDNEEIFDILAKDNFRYIEVAPLELVDDWDNINWSKLRNFKSMLSKYNLQICSMQSVFYKKKLNLFKNYKYCVNHFKIIENICNEIECNYVVFGAPQLRNKPKNVSEQKSYEILNRFFYEVGSTIKIGIEAIPEIYNTNVFNSYLQVDNFVDKSSANLYIHFDVASAYYNGFYESIKIDTDKITNIHLSKLHLQHLDGNEDFIDKLNDSGLLQQRFVSIEMKKSTKSQIKKAINVFKRKAK